MSARSKFYGVVVVGTIGLAAATQVVHADVPSHDIQIYAGELFGDHLTDRPLTGRLPVLDDNVIFGARYTYEFPQPIALQLSAAYSPGRAARVAGGDTNLELTTADVDVLYYITPRKKVYGHRLVLYSEVGMGYARARFSHALLGAVGNLPVVLKGSGGFTLNIGLGIKFYISGNSFVDFDSRYRYLNRLVNHYAQGLSTAETTVGVGYSF